MPATKKVVIRQMEIDDLAAVYHLGDSLFTSHDFPILYRTWDPYEVTQFFTTDPDFCLVAEAVASEEIVGFILATTIEKEGTAWKNYGYFTWIGIREDFHRTHVGHRLYRELEKRLRRRGVRMIIADTDGDNTSAIAFMESLGFSSRAEHLWFVKTLHGPKRSVRKPVSSDG